MIEEDKVGVVDNTKMDRANTRSSVWVEDVFEGFHRVCSILLSKHVSSFSNSLNNTRDEGLFNTRRT